MSATAEAMPGLAREVFEVVATPHADGGYAVAGARNADGRRYVDRLFASRDEAEWHAADLNKGEAQPRVQRILRDPEAKAFARAALAAAGIPRIRRSMSRRGR
ncbi:MAG: hypothetical protein M3Q74_06195 [Pseudomonadota bacterium]|nr:hypothetical protein [Pseudomonadota bacterium]